MCSQSGVPKAAEATLLMIMLHKFFLDNDVESEQLLYQFHQCYPDSLMSAYMGGFMARLTGELDKADVYFKKLLQIGTTLGSVQLKMTASYHLGYCCFLRNEWDGVNFYFETFLNAPVTETQKRFRPYSAYLLGFSYWMKAKAEGKDEREKIVSLYTRAQEWVRDHESYDVFARRKMNEFLVKKHFNEIDEWAVIISALIEGKQWKSASDTLVRMKEALLAKPNDDFEGMYLFYVGSCLKGVKDYEQAKIILKKNISMRDKIKIETFTVAYSWILLGEIAMEQSQWEEATKCFEELSQLSGYDWEKFLATRIYSNKQKIEVKRKKNHFLNFWKLCLNQS